MKEKHIRLVTCLSFIHQSALTEDSLYNINVTAASLTSTAGLVMYPL